MGSPDSAWRRVNASCYMSHFQDRARAPEDDLGICGLLINLIYTSKLLELLLCPVSLLLGTGTSAHM